jgi:hypothetical protein
MSSTSGKASGANRLVNFHCAYCFGNKIGSAGSAVNMQRAL